MLGTIVNTIAVIIGGAIGILLKRGLPEKISDTVMKGLALSTLYIGISGALKGQNTMVLIISIVIGAIIGEAVDLDDKLNSLGNFIERKFKSKDKNTSIAEGLVTASLLFCLLFICLYKYLVVFRIIFLQLMGLYQNEVF